jgi:hypothetical protein
MVRPRPVLALLPFLLAAGCLILPEPVRAERRGVFEIAGEAGFRFGGRLKGRTDPETGDELSDFHVSSGFSYGASLGYWTGRTVMVEGRWTHQDATLENRNPVEGEAQLAVDTKMEDFLIGVAIHGGRAYDRVRWWGGFHVGGTAFRFAQGTETRFAMSASAGTRTPLAARIRLHTYLRSRWAFIDRTEDFLCSTQNQCYPFPRSNWLTQWDLGVGLHYLI